MSRGEETRARARFLRRLVVGMAVFFGLGTLVRNGLPLLATDAARAELGPIPYPLFGFEFVMGWLYLAEGAAIGLGWRWAQAGAWALALLHSGSASVLWLWHFAGHAVAGEALLTELLREGFWVLIALYLWRAVAPAGPGAPAARRSTPIDGDPGGA